MFDKKIFENFNENKKIEVSCEYINTSSFKVYYAEELAKNNKALLNDIKIFYTEFNDLDILNLKEMGIDTEKFNMYKMPTNVYQAWFCGDDGIFKLLNDLNEYLLSFKILDNNENILYDYTNISKF